MAPTPVAGNPRSGDAWTVREEDALLQAINQVKGSFWTKIIALHGINGTETRKLKARTRGALVQKAPVLYKNRGIRPEFLRFNGKPPRPERAEENHSGGVRAPTAE